MTFIKFVFENSIIISLDQKVYLFIILRNKFLNFFFITLHTIFLILYRFSLTLRLYCINFILVILLQIYVNIVV